MFLFLRLLLAHLIADFPLQTDEIYRLKIKGHFGQFLHVFVIFIISVIFAGPFLKLPAMWALLIFVAASHYFIDAAKLIFKNRFGGKWTFFGFVIDQIMHIAAYIPCLLIPGLKDTRGYMVSPKLWALFYNDDGMIIYAIFFVIAVFAAIYLVESAKISYFPNLILKEQPRPKRYYEMLERFILFNAAFLSGIYLFVVPAIITLRFPMSGFFAKDTATKTVFLSYVDIGLNAAIAVLCGIILNLLLQPCCIFKL